MVSAFLLHSSKKQPLPSKSNLSLTLSLKRRGNILKKEMSSTAAQGRGWGRAAVIEIKIQNDRWYFQSGLINKWIRWRVIILKKLSFTVFMISTAFLFNIYLTQLFATFVYLRISQTDLFHIEYELLGKVLSEFMGKILPTCVQTPLGFSGFSHA